MAKNDQVDMSRARILGTPKDEEVRAGGFPAILMIRGGLDEQNTLKPKEVKKQLQMVQGPDGRPQAVEQVQAVLGREQLCTAEDLVEMMRQVVQEEITHLLYITQPSMVGPYTSYLDNMEMQS